MSIFAPRVPGIAKPARALRDLPPYVIKGEQFWVDGDGINRTHPYGPEAFLVREPNTFPPVARIYPNEAAAMAYLQAAKAPATLPRCEPPPAHFAREFHWLVFVFDNRPGWRTTDLWRWRNGAWHCVRTPGASFSPEQMHAQWWRYTEPAVAPVYRLAPKPFSVQP